MGNEITYDISLFADDATHSHSSENLLLARGPIQMDINKLVQWGTEWVTSYSETRTEYMIVSRRQNPSIFDIYMNNSKIRQTPTHKLINICFFLFFCVLIYCNISFVKLHVCFVFLEL
jgi:hypothetical protein